MINYTFTLTTGTNEHLYGTVETITHELDERDYDDFQIECITGLLDKVMIDANADNAHALDEVTSITTVSDALEFYGLTLNGITPIPLQDGE